MKKHGKTICIFLLLMMCLSFSGCTDKQGEGMADNVPVQDSEGNTESTDGSETGTENSVTVEDSGGIPDTEVKFSE